jgi:hypothetical protein
MQLRHTYRDFSLENRVFKGETWVSGQESSAYAKDYAKENPAVLRDKIKENTRTEWEALADEFDEGLNQLLKKVPTPAQATLPTRLMSVSSDFQKGVFAILKERMPSLFPDSESIQMAYKYTMMQTSGKVNVLEAGDIISLKNGVLNVSKPDGTLVYEAELYPWSLYTNRGSERVAPTEPAPAADAPAADAPAADAPAADAPAADAPALAPTEPTPAPTSEFEGMSDRNLQLKAAWEVENALLEDMAQREGVTLITEPKGPHGNNKEVVVMKDGAEIGRFDVRVPLGYVDRYAAEENVNIVAKTQGGSTLSSTPTEALQFILNERKGAPEKPGSQGVEISRTILDRMVQDELASADGVPAEYTFEDEGKHKILRITRPDGRTARIDIRKVGRGENPDGVEQFTNTEGFSVELQLDGRKKESFIDLRKALKEVEAAFKAPLETSEATEKPTTSLKSTLRALDLMQAQVGIYTGSRELKLVPLEDTPVGESLLDETFNPIKGHMGPYILTLNEKTAEGLKAGIQLDGRYVFVLIENDGHIKLDVYAQDELQKASGEVEPGAIAQTRVDSVADGVQFLKNLERQDAMNMQEGELSPAEQRERREQEKAELEKLESDLAPLYIEALRTLAPQYPEQIQKFTASDEQLKDLSLRFDLKKDPEKPTQCKASLTLTYRGEFRSFPEQEYRYEDLKKDPKKAAEAFAIATLSTLEAITPEPK